MDEQPRAVLRHADIVPQTSGDVVTTCATAWYEAAVQSESTGSIVETEDDPTPIVLILAATLRRAEETPKLAAMMRNAKGNVALRSTVDPQVAASQHFRESARSAVAMRLDLG